MRLNDNELVRLKIALHQYQGLTGDLDTDWKPVLLSVRRPWQVLKSHPFDGFGILTFNIQRPQPTLWQQPLRSSL